MSRLACVLCAVALVAACSHTSHPRGSDPRTGTTTAHVATAGSTTTVPPTARLVLAVHDGELDAVAATAPFTSQTLLAAGRRDTGGLAWRGPLCVDPVDPHVVALGASQAGTDATALVVAHVTGSGIGNLKVKLLAVHSATTSDMTIAACTFLRDSRLVASAQSSSIDSTGELLLWATPTDATAAPCVLDDTIVAPGALATGADNEVLVAIAGTETSRHPAVYAADIATTDCATTSTRVAYPIGAGEPPSALGASARFLFAALADGRVVSITPTDTVATAAHITGTTITGLAAESDGTLYVATTRPGVRSGALWMLVPREGRPRPMLSAWSAPGAIALTVAPDR
jgi:hypothetical protein